MDIAFPPSMIPAYDVHFDTLALPRLPVQPNDPKYSDYRPVSPYMYKHRPFVVARIPGTNIIDHIRLNETFSLYVYDFSFTTEAHMVIKGRGYNELEFLKKLMDDPHPGLVTWTEAYLQAKYDILEHLISEGHA